MEILFDLLPLLVIYIIARSLSRKRREAAQARETTPDDGSGETAQPDLAAMLQALGLAPPSLDASLPDAHRDPPPSDEGEALRPAAEPRSSGRNAPRESKPREAKPSPRQKASPKKPQRGPESGMFERSDFVEGGARRRRPEDAPAPLTHASRYAARLRDPETAREAMVLQMLLERRGGTRRRGR